MEWIEAAVGIMLFLIGVIEFFKQVPADEVINMIFNKEKIVIEGNLKDVTDGCILIMR